MLPLHRCGIEIRAAFEKVTDLKPDDSHVWFLRGTVLLHLDRLREAVPAFDKAFELDTKSTKALRGKGIALGRLDRYEEALTTFDKLLELDPNHANAWLCRGIILNNSGRDKEALIAFDKAIELDTEDADAWTYRGCQLNRIGRNEESLDNLNRGIELGANSPHVLMWRAEVFLALNRWETGIAAFDDALLRFVEAGKTKDYDAENVVTNLFECTSDKLLLTQRSNRLLELHYKHGAERNLGEALVRHISELKSPLLSGTAMKLWLENWQEVVGSKPEFELPLRLLNVAVRFLETHDERLLLELPTEERTILRPLLGIEEGKRT